MLHLKDEFNITAILIIIVLVFGAYANSLGNNFVWDDEILIVENPIIKTWRNFGKLFCSHLFSGSNTKSNFYRPFQSLSYMIEHAVWKLNPFGYHLTNMLIHMINCVLLYIFLCCITDKRTSLIATLLFAVHPIHTEAVTYIAGRADIFSFMFTMLCVILFLKQRYVASTISYILALMSKEVSLITPLILLWVLLILKRQLLAKDKYAKAVFTYAIIPLSAIYTMLRLTILKFPYFGFFTTGQPLPLRAMTTFKIIPIYIKLLIVPLGLHMERHMPVIKEADAGVFLGFLLIAIMWYLAFKLKKWTKLYLFCAGWFFIALLPVSNLFPLNVTIAEHWLYLPSVGFFLLLGYGFQNWIKRPKIGYVGIGVLLLIVLFYSGLTFRRNLDWKDSLTFYKSTLKYSEGTYLLHNNLGGIYNKQGRLKEALLEYEKSIQLNKYYTLARRSLALLYAKMGRHDKAKKHLEEAIKYYPKEAENYYTLGIVHEYNNEGERYGQGFDPNVAKEYYKKTISINPNHLYTHFNLAILYEYNEDGERYAPGCDLVAAEKEYIVTLAIKPNMLKAHYNFAIVYEYNKNCIRYGDGFKKDKAIAQYKEVLRLNPKHEWARENLKVLKNK